MSNISYSKTSSINNTQNEEIESKSYQFFIHNKPRYVKYKQDPGEFRKFLTAQLSNDSLDYFTTEGVQSVVYEPIMGYENLVDIHNSTHHEVDIDEIWELELKLSQLYTAVRHWDLAMVSFLFQSRKFDDYLELIQEQLNDDEAQLRIIKKLIIEQVGSLVRPFKNEKKIKEKELNLIMLLYS